MRVRFSPAALYKKGFLMKELLAHLVGDYILQNDWEANSKTKKWLPAVSHAVKYTAAFLPVTTNWKSLAVIGSTHLLLDHYRVAIPLAWAKNNIGVPKDQRYSFEASKANGGYPENTPPYMANWLMIIADNTMHLIINHLAIEGFND